MGDGRHDFWCLSSIASANSRLSFAFSASKARSRFASLTSSQVKDCNTVSARTRDEQAAGVHGCRGPVGPLPQKVSLEALASLRPRL